MQSTSVGRHQGNRFAQGTTPARTYLLPVHLRQHPVHRNEIPEPGGPTNPKGLRVLRRCQNNGATKQGVALPGGFLPNREVSHELLRIAQSIERPKSRAKRLKQTLHYDLLFETNGGNKSTITSTLHSHALLLAGTPGNGGKLQNALSDLNHFSAEVISRHDYPSHRIERLNKTMAGVLIRSHFDAQSKSNHQSILQITLAIQRDAHKCLLPHMWGTDSGSPRPL